MPPQLLVLQCVASVAGTVLGEVAGSSLTAKLIGGVLGAVIGVFLTSPGRHHRRRVVAVALLLFLLDMLRKAGTALARTVRGERAPAGGQPSAHGSSAAQFAPQSWLAALVVAGAGFAVGTTGTALAGGLSTKSTSRPASPAPHVPRRPARPVPSRPVPHVPRGPTRVATSLAGTYAPPTTRNGGATVDLTVVDAGHPNGDPTAKGAVTIRLSTGQIMGSGRIVAGHAHLALGPGDTGENSVAAYYTGDAAHKPSARCLLKGLTGACP